MALYRFDFFVLLFFFYLLLATFKMKGLGNWLMFSMYIISHDMVGRKEVLAWRCHADAEFRRCEGGARWDFLPPGFISETNGANEQSRNRLYVPYGGDRIIKKMRRD